MNMTDALPDAVAVWRQPEAMVRMWANSDWKAHHEALIARWCGTVSTVADVGCGNGRYSTVIQWKRAYSGYDTSVPMIELAKKCAVDGKETYSVVDGLAFQTNKTFSAVLLIDVAQHYPDPIGIVKAVLENWIGKTYYVSLVAGIAGEMLSATAVIPYERLLELWDDPTVKLERMYMERFHGAEHLSWILIELRKERR